MVSNFIIPVLLYIAIRYPVQSFNHSNNFIQSFIYSVFHPTILLPRGYGAIFTCDFDNLLKTSSRKLPHVPRLYFGNFHRAFKKSNNCVATMLISVISMPYELWTCWDIYEQFRGVFYWVKALLHSSSW